MGHYRVLRLSPFHVLMEAASPISEDDIRRVVRAFYTQVQTDALLAPIFATRIGAGEWEAHIEHIVNFWSSIFLKTGRFNGNPMRKHLGLKDITPAHFTRWLDVFQEVSNRTIDAPKAAAMQAMANRIGQSFQMGLAFHHENTGEGPNPFAEFGLKPQGPSGD